MVLPRGDALRVAQRLPLAFIFRAVGAERPQDPGLLCKHYKEGCCANPLQGGLLCKPTARRFIMPDYLSNAVAAAGVLTDKWFPPSAPTRWVPNDYWRTPVICTLLTDLMMQTKEVDYTTTLENARKKGEPPLTWCAYYDDLTWWGRFFMHACHYFQSQSNADLAKVYLADAKIVCDQLSEAWDTYDTPEYCNGGVWWMRPDFPPEPPYNPRTVFKASNSTLGFMETALALYLELGDQKYLDMGQKAWDWIVKWKFVDDKGMVWGALIPGDCQLDPENVPVLSLQGEALAPLWMLYQATKNTKYLDVADQVAEGGGQVIAEHGSGAFRVRRRAGSRMAVALFSPYA